MINLCTSMSLEKYELVQTFKDINSVNQYYQRLLKANDYSLKIAKIGIRNYNSLIAFYKSPILMAILETFLSRIQQFKARILSVIAMQNDRFILVLKESIDLSSFAQQLSDYLGSPILVEKHRILLETSIATMVVTSSEPSFECVLRKLSQTMIVSNNTNAIAMYTDKVGNTVKRKQQITAALIDLLAGNKKNKIVMDYQPIINLEKNRIAGFESLARLHTEALGIVSPTEFIAIAEASSMMPELSPFIIDAAFNGYQELRDIDASLALGINVSINELMNVQYINTLCNIRKLYNVPPSSIRIELTESALIQDFSGTIEVLSDLKSRGYSIVIDDFGSGYSNLSYIVHLPIDAVKIDRSFIQQLDKHDDYFTFLSGIVFALHSVGLQVAVEGVETYEQARQVQQLSPLYVQGYHYAKPLSVDRIKKELLHKKSSC